MLARVADAVFFEQAGLARRGTRGGVVADPAAAPGGGGGDAPGRWVEVEGAEIDGAGWHTIVRSIFECELRLMECARTEKIRGVKDEMYLMAMLAVKLRPSPYW